MALVAVLMLMEVRATGGRVIFYIVVGWTCWLNVIFDANSVVVNG